MFNNEKINFMQLVVIVTLYIIGPSILFEPSILVSQAKQDAWISTMLGLGIGLLVIQLYSALGNLYPNMTLVEYTEKILGKWLGKTISLLFFIYLMILSASVLRNIGDFITTEFMPETPILAIHILFMSVVIIGTRLGLESVARASEIFFPGVILLFFLIVIAIIPQGNMEQIQPVLENGIKPVLKASTSFIIFPFLELIVFLMIFPFLNQKKDFRKAVSIGAFMGGIVIFIIVALSILVLGPATTERYIYSTYLLSKQINVGDFLTRIEAVLATIWVFSIFIKLTICFYAATLSLSKTLNLKEYSMLTYPLGMILIVLSIIVSPNIIYGLTKLPKVMELYTFTFGLFLPLLLIGVDFCRKKVNRKEIRQVK
ncbi:endospore germination permease [Metabacillus fastidiosus]|uniref:GerAB/ArcD/ProY family transporter n=1 Tax=Metabacillus fastidiosus TaxID=1458 RepID=UPI002E1C89A3|nr:endospore germination permease [Metabacillus fastidiosus]